MIRRHASTLRLLLMLTDGLLAAAVLVGLSYLRFGEDWAVWWRQIIPDPTAVMLVYSVGWVVALALNGLYRPRARWSVRTEAWDLVRADDKPGDKKATLLFFDEIFGLEINDWQPEEIEIPDEILQLAKARETARVDKNWQRADEIRDQVLSAGYAIEDTRDGPRVKLN